MNSPCDLLDDFLTHDLTGEEFEQFAGHLLHCPVCRPVVDAEMQLDRLLVAAVESEPLPRGVIPVIPRRHSGRRRWHFAGTIATVAASVATIWLVARPRPLPVEIDRPRATDAPAVAAVRVKFPADDVITVPEMIDAPNVTFLWVHPTLTRNSERSLP